ncbi:MAG: DUF4276 family protein [Thiomicrospira sp.]|uniref:DUF4276 family protein n=1 Tax=Thiomicrospira sp. TaxID=935 RepID=UPI0019E534C2|nr:DUF4276 family protein [Thiomicrospira sp.]MBE0494722.1 DUF4276 family protein [Thiomicrospira sp.]
MKKIEVTVFTEGQTEEGFIKNVVAPSLRHLNVFVKPQTLNTSKKSRGGAVSYDRLHFNARNTLLQKTNSVLTTFLDFYGLETNFPNFEECQGLTDIFDKVNCLENSLQINIIQSLNCKPERFKPYIQPHEFEGLLFSNSNALVSIESEWSRFQPAIDQVIGQFKTPEHINDGYSTKPSARLSAILKPTYKKTRHGPIIAKAIGIETIESQCSHFKEWMDWLRSLAN